MGERTRATCGAAADRLTVAAFDLADRGWRAFAEPPHAIVSSLAIHHLDGGEKRALFRDLAGGPGEQRREKQTYLGVALRGYSDYSASVGSRVASNGSRRAGSNGDRSTTLAAPSTIRSAIASPVAGALRMPQTLWPVAA
jgi:hypothetical protein